MSTIYTPAAPDKQVVRLRVMDEHVDLTRWTSYSFSSHFLHPSDGWSMTIGDGSLAEREKRALRVGASVRLYVDNNPLAEGYIDRIEINADRNSGTTYTIQGRDRLAPVVDSVADPRVQFKTGTTLAEFLKTLLAPYGWVSDEHFALDGAANRDAKTGGLRGIPQKKQRQRRGKSGDTGRPSEPSQFVLYQLKPHNHEGLFHFIQRTVERFGLWVRVSADGDTLIVAGPDFTQAPLYQLRRNSKGDTNILSGTVVYDATDQPSVLIADGFSGGGEFGNGMVKAYCVNPYFGMDENGFISDEVSAVLKQYPEAEPVLFMSQPYKNRAPRIPPRPMFLHDEESKTPAQLAFFIKRTMSELLRKSLVCHYTVEGHGQNADGVFTPWDVDTVVDVQDEVGDVSERMYVLGRTFEKSRAGTFTKLELVRLYSIAVGNQEELKPKVPTAVDNTRPRGEDRIRHAVDEG